MCLRFAFLAAKRLSVWWREAHTHTQQQQQQQQQQQNNKNNNNNNNNKKQNKTTRAKRPELAMGTEDLVTPW